MPEVIPERNVIVTLTYINGLLTWSALHIVGGSSADRAALALKQEQVLETLQSEIDSLGQ